MFFAGLAPALVTLWIRRNVEESPLWLAHQHEPARRPARLALSRAVLRRGAIVTAMNAAAMFGWWGLFTWMPAYLSRPEPLGAGLSIIKTSGWIVLMQAGMWLGYVTFGYLADSLGRKPTYIVYLLVAAALVPLYAAVRDVRWLLLLGPAVAFFGTGYFSGFGAITAEIFPTEIRATAQGIAYNLGRGLSAFAPVTVGFVSERAGLGAAFSLTSAAFLISATLWSAIPETKGRSLLDATR